MQEPAAEQRITDTANRSGQPEDKDEMINAIAFL